VKHSCLLGVSHPFMNRHTQPTVVPLHGPNVPIQAHVLPSTIFSWTNMPHPWVHTPLSLCSSLCRSSQLSMGVLMESFNLSSVPMLPREDGSTTWVCSQVAPPFPKHNPSLHRPSQGKKGVCPLGLTRHHRAPRCSFPHPNIFVFPTNHFLLVLFVHSITLNLPKEHACSMGVLKGLTFRMCPLNCTPHSTPLHAFQISNLKKVKYAYLYKLSYMSIKKSSIHLIVVFLGNVSMT
jgi:hypothetical protein